MTATMGLMTTSWRRATRTALTRLYAATAPSVPAAPSSGRLRAVAAARPSVKPLLPIRDHTPEVAARLWELRVLTGVTYDLPRRNKKLISGDTVFQHPVRGQRPGRPARLGSEMMSDRGNSGRGGLFRFSLDIPLGWPGRLPSPVTGS